MAENARTAQPCASLVHIHMQLSRHKQISQA